jgi:hypothetical protein
VKSAALQAQLDEVKRQIAEALAPGEVYCKRCGATDVYWMTVLGRREANFLAKNGNLKAIKLAKARLFNVSGGEHHCQPSADDFEVLT